MNNPLVEKVKRELEQVGIRSAQLMRESYDEKSFGNALAVFKVGNLHLSFARDRGDDTLSFLNPNDENELYTFDDMSLVMGWESLDSMMEEVEKARDFSQPPPGPIPLSNALGLIRKDYEQLQRMFLPSQINATVAALGDASRERCKAMFG